MATLNLSTNGPSITKSYQSIVNATTPSGNASKSPTYAQWAVYSVSTPLVNAFQQDSGGKESILKVQGSGEGELVDLIDEFSDGRVQFAFVKVRDPNTALPKSVLVGWCGEGVPERTKGYFTSHLAAVSKVLHGYHVQVTARSDRDLTPESIVQKVCDASGSKYSGGGPAQSISGPPPPLFSKPAFTPTRSSSGDGGSFKPLSGSRIRSSMPTHTNVDEDGWGQDAPPVTRTQLEKVQSSYQPTKVNMRELNSHKPETSRFNGTSSNDSTPIDSDVGRGGYQPVGNVDIAALRRQAYEKGSTHDDRPNVIKGSYEPVGRVDIAAIRAKAQRPAESAISPPSGMSPTATGNYVRSSENGEEEKPPANQIAPFSTSERLTSLPKPKVGNRFGSGIAGTRAPTPGGFGLESKPTPAASPIGAGRTFADQGGKTPAQVWAEKKARERGLSSASNNSPSASGGSPSHNVHQNSGKWKSGYGGKSWAPVQTTQTGQSSGSLDQQRLGQEDDSQEEALNFAAGGVGAIRDRFKGAPPMGVSNVGSSVTAPSPPPLDSSSKPNAGRGIPAPGLPIPPSCQEDEVDEIAPRMPTPPAQPPRSPTPPTPPGLDPGSPIRVAMPISRGRNEHEVEDARDEQFSPPPSMPTRSLARAVPQEEDLTEEPIGHDPARGAGEAAASAFLGGGNVDSARPMSHQSGKRALVQYDYEKAEDNELELKEGEYVTNIEMVDDDWWMGQNPRGETGLFPSNYVELVGDAGEQASHQAEPEPGAEQLTIGVTEISRGATATALYEYEAAEENELSFPEDAEITGVEFPDEDWWSGEYGGQQGLFPANYVRLDE